MKFFSKSTNGFYDSSIHGDAFPSDAIEITEEEHQSLLAGQAAGKLIQSDDAGNPMVQDRAPLSEQQIIARDNEKIIEQIKTLEVNAQRAVREALISGVTDRLKQIDDQIADLRKAIKQ
ncbi:hypothetical protein ACO0K2_04425 [Undibacterium sp. MH2W]|uniref:hypothetical protein n=1 Tax=Undibacterium sp. MH2W TaxID=3413044 RepID=UPI003BF19CF5